MRLLDASRVPKMSPAGTFPARCLALLLASLPLAGVAQMASDRGSSSSEIYEEDTKYQHPIQTIQALGSEAFGEEINLYDGGLGFVQTDIALPGNDALPVRIGRVLRAGQQDNQSTKRLFGDWELDIPYLHTVRVEADGWVVPPAAPGLPNSKNRCSSEYLGPRGATAGSSMIWFEPWEIWDGLFLHVAGLDDREVLHRHYQSATNPTAPDAYGYPLVAQGGWVITCLPESQMARGDGEGFIAIAPDGTRYTFNWLVTRYHPAIVKSASSFPTQRDEEEPVPDSNGPTPSAAVKGSLRRVEALMLPTKITDRFGNFVTYTYDPNQPQNLVRIESSDGRWLNLGYDASGATITSVTDGSRTWTYGYSGRSLASLTLPDGSAWAFSMGALAKAKVGYGDSTCLNGAVITNLDTAFNGTMTHPSGATGSFTVAVKKHGLSNVMQETCALLDDQGHGTQPSPKILGQLSIVSKTLSGPGMGAQTWTYSYGPTNDSWFPCTGSCPTSKWVEMRTPENHRTRYTFSNKQFLIGQLQEVKHGFNGSTALRTETMSYATGTSNAYLYEIGYSDVERGDHVSNTRQRPLKQKIIVQDGNSYQWLVNESDFDVFARPTRETRTGSATRTDVTAYYDNLAKWVLGQVATRTNVNTGVEESKTEYTPATALPWKRYVNGQLVRTLTWNADGTLASIKDARNNTTTLGNWYRGVPRLIGYPDASASAVVNSLGQITSLTDELGYKTCYAYDPMGRITQITYPSESASGVCNTSTWAATTRSFQKIGSAEFGIAANHWRLTETTGAAVKETYFDALWRPVLTRERDSGNGATARYLKRAFDSEGKETFVSYPSTSNSPSTGTWTEYDAVGRVRTVAQDSELVGLLTTTTTYLSGFQTRTTNPRNQQTTTSYQAFGVPSYDAPLTLSEPGGVTTTITRDVFGKPKTITRSGSYTRPNGTVENQSQTRTFVYDAYQRLCKRVDPESGATIYEYDAAGNLAWSARSTSLTHGSACQRESVTAGTRSVRSYDSRNRLLGIDHPSGTDDVSYSYEADGALSSASTTNGGTWTYTYNRRRLPTKESLSIDGYTFAIGYAYTAQGHVASMTYPSGSPANGLSVSFAPNALGQATQAGSFASGATYHPDGSLKGFSYGNGIVHSRSITARGLPWRIRDARGTEPRLDHQYEYDANGNLTQITDGVDGEETRTLTYDARDRLITAAAMNKWGDQAFEYDALDNVRRWGTLATGSNSYAQDFRYQYDSAWRLDRLTDAGGALQWDYSVDGLGQTTQRSSAYSGQSWSYGWDAAGRMTGAGGESYRYDAHGHRTRSQRAGSTRYQVYSRTGQLVYTQDDQENKRTEYISLGGRLVAKRSRPVLTNTVTTTWLHTDQRGSPGVETDGVGNQTWRTVWMPYGSPADGQFRPGPGFTGHQTDSNTQLVYMQQRYYDPVGQRFLSTDPVDVSPTSGGNFNRYWYANNNPYRYTDPDGRCPNCVTGGIGALIGGLAGLAVEGYRQYQAGEFDGSALAIETGKGAVVGGLTGLTGGAVAATGLSVTSKVAITGTSAFAAGAGGEVAAQIAHGETPTVGDAVVAGAANTVGAGIGALAKPAAAAAATTTTAAVRSHPVTSLSGRVFYTVNTPASTVTDKAAAEAMQNMAGEAASAATSTVKEELKLQ